MVKDSKFQKPDSAMLAYGIYGAVGFQLAGAVIGGLLLGNWLDQKFATAPWLALAGLMLGSVGGFYNLIRLLTWNQGRKEKKSSSRDAV
jgi:ATP synthase protein I